MIHDQNCIFSDKQSITADAVSTKKINVMELLGKGNPVYVNMQVVEDFATCTSVTIDIQQCDTESGTYENVDGGSATILLADLKAGKKVGIELLPRSVTKPWLQINYTVNGTDATAGKFFSAVTRDRQDSYEAGQYINKGRVQA